MKRIRFVPVIGIVAIAAAGLGTVAGCGFAGHAPAAASTSGGSGYSYYRSMMGRLDSGSSGSMMGGTSSRGWMMGSSGYRWMMGGLTAPAWMRGRDLPGYMMGSSSDAGKAMGALFARAPGARVSAAQAARLGSRIPAGATANRAQHKITFSGTSVRLTVLASPAGSRDETFRIGGMTDPAITVDAGARVTIEVINADADTAHGLVITASHSASSLMPMVTASPAFAGAAVWFLGDPTSAGMHAGTLTFTARKAGTYRYLCPVPGQAQNGMTGTFIVSTTS
jgi:rusticyanin